MKRTLAIVSAAALLSAMALPAASQPADANKKNYIGVGVGYVNNGNTTVVPISVNAKLGLSDNVSFRPSVTFASANNATITTFTGGITYDFKVNDGTATGSNLTPYAGVGLGVGTSSVAGSSTASGLYFTAGADYNVSESVVLNANYNSSTLISNVSVGAGFRF